MLITACSTLIAPNSLPAIRELGSQARPSELAVGPAPAPRVESIVKRMKELRLVRKAIPAYEAISSTRDKRRRLWSNLASDVLVEEEGLGLDHRMRTGGADVYVCVCVSLST